MKINRKKPLIWVAMLMLLLPATIFTVSTGLHASAPDQVDKRLKALETDVKNYNENMKLLEQLTIEFADELALLNVKVSKMEDSLKNSDSNMKSLEQLTIEFADELALLNVKVGKLEESMKKR